MVQGTQVLEPVVKTFNIAGAFVSLGFILLGIFVTATPIKKKEREHWVFDRLHWATQGVFLCFLGFVSFIQVIYSGVLRRSEEDSYFFKWLNAILGFLQWELGRALFYLFTGFYIFPLAHRLDNYASMDDIINWLCYLLGLIAMLLGLALLIIDVVIQGLFEAVTCDGRRKKEKVPLLQAPTLGASPPMTRSAALPSPPLSRGPPPATVMSIPATQLPSQRIPSMGPPPPAVYGAPSGTLGPARPASPVSRPQGTLGPPLSPHGARTTSPLRRGLP